MWGLGRGGADADAQDEHRSNSKLVIQRSNSKLVIQRACMHDMGSLGRTLQIDLPQDWANLALHRDVWRGVVSRC